MLKSKFDLRYFGGIMKKLSKFCILSIILIILSISCVNASDLDCDNIQISESNSQEISIDEVSAISDSTQISDEENENNISNENVGLIGEDNKNIENVLSASSGTIHKVSPTNYTKYFNNNGYVNTNIVKSGDSIDLSGKFNKRNFTFTIPCSITSSATDAYLTNCVVQYLDINSSIYSNVSNLKFTVNIEKHPSVYIVRSSHINVFNCTAYSTGANSNPTLLVGSTYCNIHDNVFETTFTGYMNASWKRAGILLGESHYNNIYSNFVTVKDSNGIYLTTYGFEKSNYNNIYNNTINSSAVSEQTGLPNPSAWAYGVHIMGDYNTAINNTIYLMFRGVDSEGSFNQIIGNNIYALAGSYYEGNNGTDGGEYGIHASYDNIIINNTIHDCKITGAAIYVAVNNTVEGNQIYNIQGEHGIELGFTASNSLVYNNSISLISGNGIFLKGTLVNTSLDSNIIATENGTAILIKKQTNSKNPDNITISNNVLLEINKAFIDYKDVESKANITLFNNSLMVVNSTFFNIFDSYGNLKDIKINNIIFKGEFSNLNVPQISINENISLIGQSSNIIDVQFIINSSNIKVENLKITNNQKGAFKFNDAQNISFLNNSIKINSPDYALTLNSSKLIIEDNIITINGNCPAILNDNGSYILFGENIINTLSDLEILSLHDSIVKYTIYILNNENYVEFFNPDGTFSDDCEIGIGDNLKIANLTNKLIRIDIPLVISAFQASILDNCTIILEDSASSTNISNLRFKLENDLNKEFSFIIIKDGVSDLTIRNNHFNVSGIGGNVPLNAIKLIGSDYSANNIKLLNNVFNLNADLVSIAAINVMNEELYNYEDITNGLDISNNNISIYNNREDGLSYGINVKNSNGLNILNNNISSTANSAFGIYLDKINSYSLKNNFISANGFNYQRFIDYIISTDSSAEFDVKNYVYENFSNMDAAIFAKNTQKSTIKNNQLYENDALTSVVHSNNPSKDIQNIIDSSFSGDTVYLGNNIYILKDSIIVSKSINLIGGFLLDNIVSKDLVQSTNPLFNVSGQSTVNLLNMTVILDNDDLFVLSLLKNSTNPIELDYPIINIKYNNFLRNSNDVDGESVSLVKSIAERPLMKPLNNIIIEDNNLIDDMNQIRHYLFDDSSSNEINFNNGIKTVIVSNNLVCTALDKDNYENTLRYFELKLLDANNKLLLGKLIHISYNNAIYDFISDSNGIVKLSVSISGYGIYNLQMSFHGDNDYCASFSSAKLTVNKQKAKLTAPNKSYWITANKYLKATFKDMNGKPIKNKKISFILNGKTYNAYTNSKGVASLKVKISTAKTYRVTVKYAGDNVYSPISKSFKVYIKKIKTKILVKNRSYKKSKKIKKLTATLKTKSGKAIKGKKLIFTVNKKKYIAKTNKRGVATVKVKISKRKTYKFTVNFAGDKTYLKALKKAKLRIR